MIDRKFTVVENAGYVGEQDIRSFDTFRDACAFMKLQYSANELDGLHPDSLHVDIRQDWSDDEGAHQEYVY